MLNEDEEKGLIQRFENESMLVLWNEDGSKKYFPFPSKIKAVNHAS
jgi:hypothetical protein